MGLLSEGEPLSWAETKKYADHVRKHGVQQFICQYNKLKGLCTKEMKWGDEIEYMIVKFDQDGNTRMVKASLRANELLPQLERDTSERNFPTDWKCEYASFFVEGTPKLPYGPLLAHFNIVEDNMKQRRSQLKEFLNDGEEVMCLVSFPRMGCEAFSSPAYKPTPFKGASGSLFLADDIIYNGHPRFKTLTRNIRERRGSKVVINVPVFKDKNTQSPFVEDLSQFGDNGEGAAAALPDHIYMDAMGFGMGCGCLQMTFQACNIYEARYLYDQLAPICPIMLALSAAAPIFRGYLADIDCRWSVIAASVDDRTEEERGLKPLKENQFRIHKSRYDSIDSYLSAFGAGFNDIDLVMDESIYKTLTDAGIDHLLAQHVAHLFIRDPISLYREKLDLDDCQDTDHFENIQSTNWQTMRFKPPPPNSNIGWRVEFRPTEVQLTDFENAAFAVFIVLLTRVILSYKLNFIIPISKVDENLEKSQKRNAVLSEKFHFKINPHTDASTEKCIYNPCANVCGGCKSEDLESQFELMSTDEIVNGKAGSFVGLIPLIESYLNSIDTDIDTRCTIGQYLKLISHRASGQLMTTATWMRHFVMNHPKYKGDSVVSEEIAYDLLKQCDKIVSEDSHEPAAAAGLLLPYKTKTTHEVPNAVLKAMTKSADDRSTGNTQTARDSKEVVVQSTISAQSNQNALFMTDDEQQLQINENGLSSSSTSASSLHSSQSQGISGGGGVLKKDAIGSNNSSLDGQTQSDMNRNEIVKKVTKSSKDGGEVEIAAETDGDADPLRLLNGHVVLD